MSVPLPPDPNRLSPKTSKRFVIILMSSFVGVAILATALIHFGRTNPALQAKLQSIRQEMLPAQVTQEMKPRQDYVQIAQKLDAYIRYQMADKQLPGLTIALADGNGITWSKGYGFADSTAKIQATPQTVYRVASVSKLFTAAAAMQLVEKDKLNLDAPISQYDASLKFQNPFGAPITIREIMSHRSGIVREPPVGSYFDAHSPNLDNAAKSLIGTSIVYKPSSKTKYSNAAVTLLGYLIQNVSGQKYADYMQKQVLDALDMKTSAFKAEPLLQRRTATGYMWTYDGRSFKAPTFTMGIDPAAGLYTTMPDLCRFMGMLFNNGKRPDGSPFLSAESLAQMSTPQFTSESKGYGLGFYVLPYHGHLRLQHSGVQYGQATRFAVFPKEKIGVAIATNLDNANAVIDQIANYASDLMLAKQDGKPLPEGVKTTEMPRQKAAGLLGFYTNGTKFIEIANRTGHLMLYDQPSQFHLKVRNDTLITDGRLGYGTRIVPTGGNLMMDGELFTRTPLPNFSYPTRWKEYVGEYGEAHNILFIYPKQGKLFARIEWFDDYPLQEMGQDYFTFPSVGLYQDEPVSFKRNANGKIEGVYAAGVYFRRRNTLTHRWLQGMPQFTDNPNGVFYIKPQMSRDSLVTRALKATPPQEGDKLPPDLIEPSMVDHTIKLDIRYASTRNFMGMRFYDEPHAFLQRPAAEAVLRANAKLHPLGYGLLIHDAYRPWYVTKMFWDATPQDQKDFVANPQKGSRHNRGCAVDLTLYDLKTGEAVEMPSLYDEFSPRAYPDYAGGTPEQNRRRAILNEAMTSEGFTRNPSEWWHFDYREWERYPISNLRFNELKKVQ